ncbi:MAG TPA: hypothetical protein VJY42_00930 [Candidatus Methanomethylophilaceae archaeon]|nr:hypothetical protein [Candidatus Methanomethylophilaceae archaeon]
MNNKTIAMVIVAVLAVAAVGVGIYFVYGNEDTPDTMSFLIEDGINDPFWIEGRGDDGLTAFVDACEKYDVDLKMSESESMGKFIESIANLGTVSDGDNWIYWNLFVYVDEAWEASEVGISGLEFSKGKCTAWVYGSWDVSPSIEP